MNLFFFFIHFLAKALSLIIPLLVGVAFLTGLERKVMGSMHQRKGPNVVGFFGTLQPFADGLKLFLKETILPSSANTLIFTFAPITTFFISLVVWAVIPFENHAFFAEINVGVLYIFGVSSLGIYGIITSGWASNSKWSFLGALRSAAQMISYEVSLGIIILCVIVCTGSLDLLTIVESQRYVFFIIPLFPLAVIFFVSGLAETNRAPFDLPEAEAELVSGYSTEYSAMGFALFFLAEYSNMILMASLFTIYFLGGWINPFNFFIFQLIPGCLIFGTKTTFVLFLFVWVRAAFPRFRYDQLMRLGWKIFLPLSLGCFLFISSILFSLDLLL